MSRSARERASDRETPEATYSSVVRSRWYWNSSVSSCSTRPLRNSERRRSRILCTLRMTGDPSVSGRLDHEADGRRQPLPLSGLRLQRAAPGRGQPVVLRPAVVLAESPFGCNPSVLFQLVEGGVEGALSHTQL